MTVPEEKAVEGVEEYRLSIACLEEVALVKIEILEKSDSRMRLLIEETDTAFMNALRRIITSEVPSMAVDDVVIIENSSALQDEFLAHRIGLIPLRTDLETYNLPEDCKCKSEFGCNLCRVSLILDVEATDHALTVYSGDFTSENPAIVPASSRIPIAKLAPEQKVRLEAYARLGRGKDHARWQPASLAAYKHMPIITVDAKLCDLCGDCIKVCPKNVLVKAGNTIEIRNIIGCTLCQDCVDACSKTPQAIEVAWDEHSFAFDIESTGALPPEKILQAALGILDGKVKKFQEEFKGKEK
jgi:DNA-directed RNA polymerase subunit D